MTDLSLLPPMSPDATAASARRPRPDVVCLLIGAAGLPAKEQTLLRSLVRLLDGRAGLRLQFSDELGHCNVVFVPEGWSHHLPMQCISVQLRAEPPATPGAPSSGLIVTPPLRASNVMAVLASATTVLAGKAAFDPGGGLASLFLVLTRLAAARERRTTVLPLLDGSQLCIDFTTGLLHGHLSLAHLLAGDYSLGAPRRAEASEAEALRRQPSLRLRDLIWWAAHQLGQDGAPGDELRGAYELRRWPDAVALSRPGYPRLAALLTRRPMGCEQASVASGLTLEAVRWFLVAALALGIAGHAVPVAATRPDGLAPSAPPRSLLGRLRERLKLW